MGERIGPNPSGLCMCGCGEPAPIARENRTRDGHVKGQALRYISGHNTRVLTRERRSVPLFIRLLERRIIVGDCWEWAGRPHNGYGTIYYQGRIHYVHRLAYELFVGPYPAWSQHTDHLCRNGMCFNPEHLEAVTARENSLRGVAPSVVAYRTGICQRGHAMTPDNVFVRSDTGARQCRKCIRMRRRRYAKARQAHVNERRRTDPEFAERLNARKRALYAARRDRERAAAE